MRAQHIVQEFPKRVYKLGNVKEYRGVTGQRVDSRLFSSVKRREVRRPASLLQTEIPRDRRGSLFEKVEAPSGSGRIWWY